MRPPLTIGIEEEYQTIDPQTRDLRSHIEAEMIAKGYIAEGYGPDAVIMCAFTRNAP